MIVFVSTIERCSERPEDSTVVLAGIIKLCGNWVYPRSRVCVENELASILVLPIFLNRCGAIAASCCLAIARRRQLFNVAKIPGSSGFRLSWMPNLYASKYFSSKVLAFISILVNFLVKNSAAASHFEEVTLSTPVMTHDAAVQFQIIEICSVIVRPG